MGGVLLEVAYDGTRYHGFQFQTNGVAVQNVIEEALAQLEKRFVRVKGASRTDAGVHAVGQRVFFTTDLSIPDRGYIFGMNSILPADVAVTGVRRVPHTFNARLTRGKLYEYVIRNGRIPNPIATRYEWHCFKPLDLDAMREAAACMVGEHNFKSFQASDCERENTDRTLTRVDVISHGELVRIKVGGTAFLKNMVRIIAGTLFAVGRGTFTPRHVTDIILAQDRTLAGPTLPAKGLTLLKVIYGDEDDSCLHPGE